MIWVITDTHFYHRRMTELCGRPEDFTARICAGWRDRVAPADLVLHLGDVAFCGLGALGRIMAELPGTIILVRGNHDRKPSESYRTRGFAAVCTGIALQGVWCTHRPALTLPEGCTLNLCGHIHTSPARVPAHTRVLALEAMDYAPQPLDEIIAGRWTRTDLAVLDTLPVS
jgi:calcineurin-like phosphoesterase family protein